MPPFPGLSHRSAPPVQADVAQVCSRDPFPFASGAADTFAPTRPLSGHNHRYSPPPVNLVLLPWSSVCLFKVTVRVFVGFVKLEF